MKRNTYLIVATILTLILVNTPRTQAMSVGGFPALPNVDVNPVSGTAVAQYGIE